MTGKEWEKGEAERKRRRGKSKWKFYKQVDEKGGKKDQVQNGGTGGSGGKIRSRW